MQDDEARCKEVSPYIHSFWKDLHIKSGCLCVDERVAIPNLIKDAVLESIHMTHPGSWGMISLSQIKNSTVDEEIYFKELIPDSSLSGIRRSSTLEFFTTDKEIYFLTCIDRHSKYPTVEIFEKAIGTNVVKFLREYAYNHGIPRTIRLDQATCPVGKQVTNYCNENNIHILDAPVGDLRAIGLVERTIQIVKRRLSCMKAENKETFATSIAINQIFSDLRLTKQKTTKITPFEAQFGRPANTPLKNISTVPSSLNLNHEKIINHYLDANTVPADDFLDESGWINPDRSDLEIGKNVSGTTVAGRRYRDSDSKVSRFILHPKISNPIPRTESSLNIKLAEEKLPNKKRAKRQLAGLYEVLKPGSYVTKSSPTTTIINEPGRAPVKVRDSESSALKRSEPPTCGSTRNVDHHHTSKRQRRKQPSIVTI